MARMSTGQQLQQGFNEARIGNVASARSRLGPSLHSVSWGSSRADGSVVAHASMFHAKLFVERAQRNKRPNEDLTIHVYCPKLRARVL